MFYGFVAFITVGLLYSYRYVWRARGWMELAYGLGGLFIMGLGIRAVLQVADGRDDGRPTVARRRVLLLFGGRSAEHDVSRVTAVAVARALDPEQYEIVPVAITTDGRWLLADEARAHARRGARRAARRVRGRGRAGASSRPTGSCRAASQRESGATLGVDVVLPLLHGPYGEDGTVQGLLELAGLPYVGAGRARLGGRHGQDHDEARVRGRRAAARARTSTLRDGHDVDAFARPRSKPSSGFPCFVKPANMGSSVGVSKAHDARRARRRDRARARVRRVDPRRGGDRRAARSRSAVLGDDPPEASVPGEIVPGAEFYDYADKYEDGKARAARARAARRDAETDAVRALAVRAFEACRCEAMARVDFFLRADGRVRRQRAEHDPRLHADLDVPEAVGGHRPPVLRSCSTA